MKKIFLSLLLVFALAKKVWGVMKYILLILVFLFFTSQVLVAQTFKDKDVETLIKMKNSAEITKSRMEITILRSERVLNTQQLRIAEQNKRKSDVEKLIKSIDDELKSRGQ